MKILIVEDNVELNNSLKEILEISGYLVESAYDGEEALDYILSGEYDLIILDILLPKLNGYEVCKVIREKGIKTPVLMLTAKGTIQDKVKGLNIGADDYLVKPFDIDELIARIKALLRRASTDKADTVQIGDLEIDFDTREVKKKGKKIIVPPKLFCILEQLVRNRGKVVSYETLMNKCWDINDYPTKENVRANIKLLRRLLEDKDLIHNVVGVGYKIDL